MLVKIKLINDASAVFIRDNKESFISQDLNLRDKTRKVCDFLIKNQENIIYFHWFSDDWLAKVSQYEKSEIILLSPLLLVPEGEEVEGQEEEKKENKIKNFFLFLKNNFFVILSTFLLSFLIFNIYILLNFGKIEKNILYENTKKFKENKIKIESLIQENEKLKQEILLFSNL